MNRLLAACAAAALVASGAHAQQPASAPIPGGAYVLDKNHASLIFRVSHLGFSNYAMAFKSLDAKLSFDPAHPDQARIEATIDPKSLDLYGAPAGFLEEILGAQFMEAAKYPQITFRSTKVEVTGDKTARITGDLTLHGVTKPITLEATFNGGYPGLPKFDPQARIGFSATGMFNRSDFGIGYGVPQPGTTMGVSDAVRVRIEAEFTGPPMAQK